MFNVKFIRQIISKNINIYYTYKNSTYKNTKYSKKKQHDKTVTLRQ